MFIWHIAQSWCWLYVENCESIYVCCLLCNGLFWLLSSVIPSHNCWCLVYSRRKMDISIHKSVVQNIYTRPRVTASFIIPFQIQDWVFDRNSISSLVLIWATYILYSNSSFSVAYRIMSFPSRFQLQMIIIIIISMMIITPEFVCVREPHNSIHRASFSLSFLSSSWSVYIEIAIMIVLHVTCAYPCKFEVLWI